MSGSQSQFTTWVTDANQGDRQGTYITEITAYSAREAMLQAIEECAAEWEADPRTLVCLGVAEGSVAILAWDDAGYTHKELTP